MQMKCERSFIMRNKLTEKSSFEDFQNLIKQKDECLIRQIKYLNGNDFNKESDKGYLLQNLHFFLSVVYQGVSRKNQELLKILYPNQVSKDGEDKTIEDSAWRSNAARFVYKEEKPFGSFNDHLKQINSNTKLETFMDESWYDLEYFDEEDKKKKPIFYNEFNKTGDEKRAKKKMKQIAEFLIYGKQVTSKGGFKIMADPYELLLTNKQLIMNGPPGTGKTYSARNEIADKLFHIEDKTPKEKEEIKKIQMEMVQFHPSFDYTDFIEGIRPVVDKLSTTTTGSIGYTLKNGSFKKFCRRAGVIERIMSVKKKIEDCTIEQFLKGEDVTIIDFWKKWIANGGNKSIIDKYNENNSVENIALVINRLPHFLFIIDEINRAEISKVLGEIMYCLDADYRGSKGAIATQYSTMATDESFFIDKENDKFFIPSNVYIIGIMNDIDRSVEVFDFALRRRFAWHEVRAEDVMDIVLKKMKIDEKLGNKLPSGKTEYEDYTDRIKELNDAIFKDLKLSRHYYLGPSYFAKIDLYLSESDYNNARSEVWNNHIEQILNEYVKGKKTETLIGTIGENFMNIK